MSTQRDPEADWLPHCIRCDGRHLRHEPCVTNYQDVSRKGGLMNAAPLVDRKELPRPLAKMLQHIEDARLHLTQANISESDKVILDEVLEHAINLVEAVRP